MNKITFSKDFNAILVLSDGMYFLGKGIGQKGQVSIGEMCFNTSLTGYQEILTDPSYYGQIINFTFPHIGNVGTNPSDMESDKIYCSGLVLGNDITDYSNYRAVRSLNDFLLKNKVVGIAGIDTRMLTKYLRLNGLKNGLLYYGSNKEVVHVSKLAQQAASVPTLDGSELTQFVTTKKAYDYEYGLFSFKKNAYPTIQHRKKIKVAVIDFGIKRNILNHLVSLGFTVKVFPSTDTFEKIESWAPRAYFLSNGPGDPFATYGYTKKLFEGIVQSGKPVFGICLGHQLLSIVAGLKTKKMEQGHRGVNHPVKNLETGSVEITTQNHGFCVANEQLPENICITHLSLFDNTIDGMRFKNKPIFAVQYHPESSAGPHDSQYLFDRFFSLAENYQLPHA
ncbi:MAG: glutamine-hydrolyzing carbamoyl-phosphate synthase small subunit [Phycisphaerales bacterium]|nr:glutamine-hydrolyzing carbamoyl-phosphate synthase small subunit [Phycisphaerales bacterium]